MPRNRNSYKRNSTEIYAKNLKSENGEERKSLPHSQQTTTLSPAVPPHSLKEQILHYERLKKAKNNMDWSDRIHNLDPPLPCSRQENPIGK